MKREINIPEFLDKIINSYIHSHSKFNNLSEFAIAAFDYFLKNEEFLQSKITALDLSD